ncbi:MAG TPA: hypothetical protein PKL39_01875 [Bacillota bacterium]|nr:hypothetical protein [Bacillota bacterium]HPZ90085.1 hypothetical protein [Bacillota bacterium]HQE01031.1 hypothetical protein [Bacillota bacterium]
MVGISLFAGANSAKGFYSFYRFLNRDDYQKVFILKGGPGTGKSTLLRELARQVETRHPVDRYFCSADENSLDGIFIHRLNIAVVDGTAPHVLEPRLPGAVHQIVDLGACWDDRALHRHRKEIQTLKKEITAHYQIAYQWLALAARQKELMQATERPGIIYSQAATDAAAIIDRLPSQGTGGRRKAFASAITGTGLVSFLHQLQEKAPVRVYLQGDNRAYNDYVLKAIAQVLEKRRISALYLYCALQPEYLEHIFIPGAIAVITVHSLHDLEIQGEVFGPPEPDNSALAAQIKSSLQQATAALFQARQRHFELETLYTPHMDFDCANMLRQQILERILEMEKTR